MTEGFEVLIWGGRGHAKVLAPIVRARGGTVVAVFDRNPDVPPPLPDVPMFNDEATLDEWLAGRASETLRFAVAVGSDNRERCALAERLSARGLRPLSLVHPDASVGVTSVAGRHDVGMRQQTDGRHLALESTDGLFAQHAVRVHDL